MNPPLSIIITDTSVLINFLAIDRVGLLPRCGHRFIITDHVLAEVTAHYPDQLQRLNIALHASVLEQITVTDPVEVGLFQSLSASGRLGAGECSAIAVAIHRQATLAIDDRRAAKDALALDSGLSVVGTQELMVKIIKAGLLDVAAADAIKTEWSAKHRFTLKVASFADLI